MYPGIVTESAKVPMTPGVGIAPTFTISRAILSDAVALVRGDRFYTASILKSSALIPPDLPLSNTGRLSREESDKLGLQ